jgi:hypothetical protein
MQRGGENKTNANTTTQFTCEGQIDLPRASGSTTEPTTDSPPIQGWGSPPIPTHTRMGVLYLYDDGSIEV